MPLDGSSFFQDTPVITLLRAGAARLSDPLNWCKKALSKRLPDGRVQMCMIGSISTTELGNEMPATPVTQQAAAYMTTGLHKHLLTHRDEFVRKNAHQFGVPAFNDLQSTTHEDVVAAFNDIIEHAIACETAMQAASVG